MAVAVPKTAVAAILFSGAPFSIAQNQKTLTQNSTREFELEDFNFWAEQCLLLRDEREYDKALEACEKAITLQPNRPNTALWFARSDTLSQLGRYPEALSSLKRVVDAEPNNSLAIAQQCTILYQLGRSNDALDTCDQALQVDGNWGDRSPAFAWYYRGLVLRDLGRLETALGSFNRAQALDDSNPLITAGRCEILAEMQSSDREQSSCGLEQAIAAYERALTLTPGDVNLWIQQGLALEQQGAYERALTAYEQALQLSPKSSLVLARRCGVLNNLKNYAAALESCTSAFQGDERWGWQGASALLRRCEVLRQSEKGTVLPDICSEFPASSGQPRQYGAAFAWNQQSIALAGLGRYQEALASADRAIAIDPYYASAWNSQAVSLWGLTKNQEALNAVNQSLKLYSLIDPLLSENFERVYPEPLLLFYRSRVTALFNQGRIYAAKGNYADAINSYRTAREMGTTRPISGVLPVSDSIQAEIALNLGVAYLQVDNYSEALNETDRAIELMPSDPFPGFYNRALIEMKVRNYVRAIADYERADQLQPNNLQVVTGRAIAMEGLARQCSSIATVTDVIAAYDRAIGLDPNATLAQVRRNAFINSIDGQINRPLPGCPAPQN